MFLLFYCRFHNIFLIERRWLYTIKWPLPKHKFEPIDLLLIVDTSLVEYISIENHFPPLNN